MTADIALSHTSESSSLLDIASSFASVSSIGDATGPLLKLVRELSEFAAKYREIEASLSVRLSEIATAYSRFEVARCTEAENYQQACLLAQDLVSAAKLSGDHEIIIRAGEVLICLLQTRPQHMKEAGSFAIARLERPPIDQG